MITLKSSEIYIWYRRTASLGSDVVQLAERHLSSEERVRRDRLRFEADRRDFTIAHDLLRRALSRYADVSPTDWRFAINKYGKPSIDNINPLVQALSFSLSHTRGCVACAITLNAPLGVDIERTDQSQRVQEVADHYFSESEAVWLRQCSHELRDIRFAELWTLKEAFLKAVGIGLWESLTCVSFQLDAPARIAFSAPPIHDPREWHFALFKPINDARLGIAIRSFGQPRFFVREDDGNGRALAPLRVSTPAHITG